MALLGAYPTNIFIDEGGKIERRPGLSGLFADVYDKRIKEINMPYTDEPCNKASEETPLQRELNHRRYQVHDLRASIARKQEELRIANALLKTIQKLAKGGK